MSAEAFFAKLRVRPFGGELSEGQVSGINALLTGFNSFAQLVQDIRFRANILGQTYWESNRTMEPIRELGEGRGREYGDPAGPYNEIYYGRGFIQLTWLANYEHAQDRLDELGMHLDLVKNPDLALVPNIAAAIAIVGMVEGWFTTRKLGDYFNSSMSNWKGARRIINSLDHATIIAQYSRDFMAALEVL